MKKEVEFYKKQQEAVNKIGDSIKMINTEIGFKNPKKNIDKRISDCEISIAQIFGKNTNIDNSLMQLKKRPTAQACIDLAKCIYDESQSKT